VLSHTPPACTNFDGIAGPSDVDPKTSWVPAGRGEALTLRQLDSAANCLGRGSNSRPLDHPIYQVSIIVRIVLVWSDAGGHANDKALEVKSAVDDLILRTATLVPLAGVHLTFMTVERHLHTSQRIVELTHRDGTRILRGPRRDVTRATAEVRMATITQPQTKDASDTHVAHRHVLVPLDGDPLFERVLPYVERITERASAYVTLLRATNPRSEIGVSVPGLGYNPLASPQAADLEAANAMAYLEPIAARLRASGLETRTSTAVGRAADVILDRATAEIDLIAMATRGRGYPARALLGSVPDAVVRKAQLPILLVSETCTRLWPEGGPRKMLIAVDDSAVATSILKPATAFARQVGAMLFVLHVVDPVAPSARAYAPVVARRVLGTELSSAHLAGANRARLGSGIGGARLACSPWRSRSIHDRAGGGR
jgi:nucleotide-binding universal stress UspA family protein